MVGWPLWVKVTGPCTAPGSSSTRVGGAGDAAGADPVWAKAGDMLPIARPTEPARKARRPESAPQPSSFEHMGFPSLIYDQGMPQVMPKVHPSVLASWAVSPVGAKAAGSPATSARIPA